jgi:hypothetical protein
MSLGQICVLAAIVAAFLVFAAALGWGDYRAQQLARLVRDRDRKEDAAALNKTDQGAATASATAQARWPQPTKERLQKVA